MTTNKNKIFLIKIKPKTHLISFKNENKFRNHLNLSDYEKIQMRSMRLDL